MHNMYKIIKFEFKKVKLDLQIITHAINHSVSIVTKAKILQRINNNLCICTLVDFISLIYFLLTVHDVSLII
jgi:hypothetical protein